MRYREMRIPCDTEVAALLGEEIRRVRFVNISPSGARIEGLGRVPRGALVTVAHLWLRLPARVAWCTERQAGLRFVLPLSGAEVNTLRGVGEPRGRTGWAAPSPLGFREMT